MALMHPLEYRKQSSLSCTDLEMTSYKTRAEKAAAVLVEEKLFAAINTKKMVAEK